MNRAHHETEIVSTLCRAIADQIGNSRFQLWFSATRWQYHEGLLVIRGQDLFRLRWLESKMRREIASICGTVVGRQVEVRFEEVTASEAASAEEGQRVPLATTPAWHEEGSSTTAGPEIETAASQSSRPAPEPPPAMVHRRYRQMEEFIVGSGNQVAAASVRMVVQEPGQVNPLFLYGPPGSGKTHLAESIYSALRAQPGRRRCVFLTAEQFTSYFLTSLHGRGIPSFRQRYRNVGLLVIEDVQFLANKPATVQELLHTADAVVKDGGQLVFSADRSPRELVQLGQELVTRFCGGMVARLEPLDVETRQALLLQLAGQRGIMLDRATAELIAGRLVGDARHVSGALLRLHAYSAAWGKEITPNLAMEALDDLFQVQSRVVRLDDIERVVCEVFGLDRQKLQSKNRTQRVTQPRMLAMWLARKHTGSALSEIGLHFGKRSHSSVVMAEKKINAMVATGSQLRLAEGSVGVQDVVRRIEQKLMVG